MNGGTQPKTSLAAAATAEGPLVEIKDLHKAMGPQQILRGVNLAAKRGETLALIGPSGEGKTVLIKHIIGLLRPDKGSVIVDGVEVTRLREREFAAVRRKVGMLFQNAALFDSLTVEENVAFPLIESGIRDRKEINQRVQEALEVVDLDEHATKLPVNLSGGMRKRAGIARAIVTHAQCILYDEPTASLDPVVSDVIDQMIIRLQKRFRITSIVVTHDMKTVFKIADRVAMLKGGVIRFCGTKEELRSSTDGEIQDFIEGRSHVQG
jgi:phospholipid/cholesterol/gamma-HCH transport system ATP-binding protein